MTSNEIAEQLEAMASSDNVVGSSSKLTEAWSAANVGVECIEPILRFMEDHPDLDYGLPGPLVHFVEKFFLNGYDVYEKKLLESVDRRPTSMNVWMVNRVLNVTKEPQKRTALLQVMRQAAKHPKADKAMLEDIEDYVEWQDD
jgi:hypothetical protein